MCYWKRLLLIGAAVLFLAGPSTAYYDEYDDSQSHPLRIIAYVLHPVGYTLEWLLFRPIHAVVSQPELEPVFGHTPHGHELDYRTRRMTTPQPLPSVTSTVDSEAARRAAEEAKAAAEAARQAAEQAAQAAEKANRGFEKSLSK